RLMKTAVAIADAIAEGLRPGAVTAPFSVELPPPPPDTSRLAGLDGWDATFDAAAAKFGLVREDPAAYHAAFPRLPVPGAARGVFRGTLPAGGAHGRLAFHEHGGVREGSLRGAALFEAPAGAEPTPPGGVLHERTGMVVGVGEGVVACWTRSTEHQTVSVTPTAEKAQATLRELGLLA
ncbi:MAG: hypothetical protein MUC84_11095, partial [Solirubrobacteraceae bacterium]|nr:hypothetical protein [Solirubrobacteraceae bacterium]